MKTYYLEEFKYMERSYFCIWYSDEVDGFYMEENKIVYFNSLEEVKQYCLKHGILYIEEENMEYSRQDMHAIQQWVSEGNGDDVDCNLLLTFWNIVTDLAATLKIDYVGDDDKYFRIYDKLFHGNNLPMINTSGKTYIPAWTDEEVLELKQVIGINCWWSTKV
jgi:hypothetical protein